MEKYDVEKTIRKNWRKFLRIFQKRADHHIVFFTNDMIQEYADCHKMLQAAVAIVSNYRVGIDVKNKDFSPRGIYKYEGGVRVDNKEIVIKRKSDGAIYCYNDWDDKENNMSAVVKEVTEEILSIQHNGNVGSAIVEYVANNTNVSEGILWKKIVKFVDTPYGGDPLNGLFS